jgi:hypothetical protein
MVFALMDLKVRLRKAEDLVNKLYRASTKPIGRPQKIDCPWN